MEERLHIIGTQDTAELTKNIVSYIEKQILWTITFEISDYMEFANWETQVQLNSSMRWKHNYIIFDVNGNKKIGSKIIKYNDRFVQALLIAKCAKWHWAKTINLVPTAFPYARQDKISQWWNNDRKAREPFSAQFVKDIFQDILSTDYCITVDAHNPTSLSESWNTNFLNLYTWWFVKAAISESRKSDTMLCPMDQWWDKKISSIARDLGTDYCNVIKKRDTKVANKVEDINVYWEIESRNILIHDDILDTWWSLVKLIKKLTEKKPKSINIAITHWMFNNKAIEQLQELYDNHLFENIYVTNSIYRENLPAFVKTIDSSILRWNTILSIFKWESVDFDNASKIS